MSLTRLGKLSTLAWSPPKKTVDENFSLIILHMNLLCIYELIKCLTCKKTRPLVNSGVLKKLDVPWRKRTKTSTSSALTNKRTLPSSVLLLVLTHKLRQKKNTSQPFQHALPQCIKIHIYVYISDVRAPRKVLLYILMHSKRNKKQTYLNFRL